MAGDHAPGGTIKVRMWGPSVGVAEDPATGAAAAVLAGSLGTSLPDRDGDFSWSIEQGTELGRPSFIKASAEKRDGRVVSIRVGGGSVIVGEGSFTASLLAVLMTHRCFILVDVFITEQAFGGNQLGRISRDAEGISDTP